MKKINKICSAIISTIFFVCVYSMPGKSQATMPKYEMNVSKEFYNNIVYLDSLFFDAYNRCNIVVMDSLISENLEFYHDKGGFSNSKKETIEAVKKNICGKVTRELLKGSIEVYEIKNFGAIEIGFHGFHNNQEQQPEKTHFSKFIHIWHLNNNRWQLFRVISLH